MIAFLHAASRDGVVWMFLPIALLAAGLLAWALWDGAQQREREPRPVPVVAAVVALWMPPRVAPKPAVKRPIRHVGRHRKGVKR